MQRAGASREIGNTPEKLCLLRYLELEAPGTSFLVDESKRWKLERRRTITQLHPPLPSPLTRNIERDAKFENCLCHTLPLYSIFFLAANSFKTFHPFVIPSTVPNSMHRSSCLFRRDINEIATKLPAQVAK